MTQEGMNNLHKQVFSLWITPEINERKKTGELPVDFRLRAAQVIFSWGLPPKVRLNKEVNAVIHVRPKRSVEKGEILSWQDVEDISGLDLCEDEKDLGHITLLVMPDKNILITFNFLYGEWSAKKYYQIGKDFLLAAQDAFAKKLFRPMIENLSVAAENFAKAVIHMVPDKEIRKVKKHSGIQSRINIHYKSTGIIKAHQKDAYNEIMTLRDAARYNEDFAVDDLLAKKLLNAIESFEFEMPPMFREEKILFKKLKK